MNRSSRLKKEIQEFCESRREDVEKGRIILWMQDECHQLWGDCCGYVWGKKGARLAVPMTNFRERQTWYGALNCYTGEFIVSPYESGNTSSTVSFVESLYKTAPHARHLIIWEGASHHRSDEFRKYLSEKNEGLSKDEYKITCLFFAPHAPEQNSVEDVWLRAKTEVRRRFSEIKVFEDATDIFKRFLEDTRFFFAKTKAYTSL